MKQIVVVFLLICCIFSMISCSPHKEPEDPVTFYYRRENITYSSSEDVISGEFREAKGHKLDIEHLLKEYLKGPLSDGLTNFIPQNTKLVKFSLDDDSARVLLSDGFARLSGLDLTVTCACITLTVIGLTNVKTVQISTQNVPLNNQPHITMNEDCLMLLDNTTLTATQ